MNKLTKSFLFFLLAGTCFTLGNTYSKQTTVSIWALTSLRFLSTAVIIFVVLGVQLKENFLQKNLKLHLLSILFLLRTAFIIKGFQLSALAKPLAIILTWPILFTILSVIFLGTKLNKISVMSLSLAAVGMFLILGDPSLLAPGENFLGYGCMIIGSAITAIEFACNRRPIETQGGLRVLFYSTFVAGLLTAPTLGSFFSETNHGTALIGLFVTLTYVIGTIFLFFGLQTSNPITTAVFSYIEVPLATIAALYFYNEDFSVRSIMGIAFILVGAILVSTDQAKQSKVLLSGTEASAVGKT